MASLTFIIGIIICTFSFSEAIEPNPCTDPKGLLAWKILQSAETGHMKYTGFKDSEIVCIYLSKISEDWSTMSVTYNFTYQFKNIPVVHTNIALLKVEECDNRIGAYFQNRPEKVGELSVLYTNFDTCTIYFNEHQQACQLWAYNDATNEDINSAQQCSPPPKYDTSKFLDSFTNVYNKYATYLDRKICISKVQIPGSNSEGSALYTTTYRTPNDTDKGTLTERYVFESCSNKAKLFDQTNENKLLANITLVYTNYKTCSIFENNIAPFRCQLYVTSNATRGDIQNCRYGTEECSPPPDYNISKFLGSFTNIYNKYATHPEQFCISKVQIPGSVSGGRASYMTTYRTLNDTEFGTLQERYEFESCSTRGKLFDETDGEMLLLNLTLVYTNYKTCFIFTIGNAGSQCSLYVASNATTEEIQNCREKYPAECGTEIVDTFNTALCGSDQPMRSCNN
ncbi:uncharacterized protein ISCGN_018206 [Ixodes scapularis]